MLDQGGAAESVLLKVRGLRRSFAAVHAVDGLDLDVTGGSITGLIGPNGCGKTTSVNCISGFDTAYAGSVELLGTAITRWSADAAARAGVMRTFQAVRTFDRYSVLENAMIGMQSFDGLGWPDVVLRTAKFKRAEKEAAERAASLLDRVGLRAKMTIPAGELSYGQKKLLALVSTLMSIPKLVILDEPVAGVNPALTWEIAEMLRGFRAQGATFLIIEHNIEFVMAVCDQVHVMDRGRRLMGGAPEEVRRDPRVIEAYLGGNID